MRTLRLGMVGDDVRRWETFLVGTKPTSVVVVDGTFDETTFKETKCFQLSCGFTGDDVDGVVGPITMGKAMLLGFDPLNDTDMLNEFGPHWPPRPEGILEPNAANRHKLFGSFDFVPAPTAGNPEAIRILGDWTKKNIVTVPTPTLAHINVKNVQVNRLIQEQFMSLMNAWDTKFVLTWGGSFVPRFIRGSRTYLSNHAWGTAFDINVQWNMLGTRPALKGKKGSVRELVMIAYEHGFFWGGWWKSRPDGMHFEAFKVMS